jgi:hypothetical protein
VVVSYSDGRGTAESLTSAAVGPVANVNDAPSGLPTISGTASENQTLTANTTGIADADGLGAFSYQWQRNGADIAGAIASTYLLSDADVGANISVRVSYTDARGTAESVTSAQSPAVANVNDAPAGANTTVSAVEDLAYTFVTGDFGFSDPSDVPANNLAAVTITGLPGGGTLALSGVAVVAGQSVSAADIGAGKLKFTPAADANGAGYTSLSFQVQDDGGTAGGGIDLDLSANTLTINVTAVNDQPLIAVPGAQTTPLNTALLFSAANGTALSVADIDQATGGLAITLTATNGTLALATTAGLTGVAGNGSASVSFTGRADDVNTALDGLLFVPNSGFLGTAGLQLLVDDLGGTGTPGAIQATASVAIDVSYTAPTLTATSGTLAYAQGDPATVVDPGLTLAAGTLGSLTQAAVDISASYAGGQDVLEFDTLALPGGVSANWDAGAGTLTFTGSATASQYEALLRTVTYRNSSAAPSTATRTVTFSVDDGLGTAAADRQVAVVAVNDPNDAPSIAAPGPQSAVEDTALVFSTGNGNVISVSDPDLGAGALLVTLNVSQGTLTLSTTSGLTFASGDGSADTTMVFSGTLADISAALNGLAFMPLANVAGAASLSISASDQGGSGSGGAQSDAKTIAVSVAAVNDAPTGALSVTGGPAPGQTLVVDVSGIGDADGLGVLAYQWLQSADGGTSWTPIAGATAATYTLGAADLGTLLRASVSYVDGADTGEAVISGDIGPVTSATTNTTVSPTPELLPPTDLGTGTLTGATGSSGTTATTSSGSNSTTSSSTATTSTGTGATSGSTQSGGRQSPMSGGGFVPMGAGVAEGSGSLGQSGTQSTEGSSTISASATAARAAVAETRGSALTARFNPSVAISLGFAASEQAGPGPGSLSSLAPIGSGLSADGMSALDQRALASYRRTLGNSSWVDELDRMREQVDNSIKLESVMVGSSVAVSGTLSVGYVIWLLRGGLLMSSLLSSLPAWTTIDPLPVLGRSDQDEDQAGDEADPLERLFGKAKEALGLKREALPAAPPPVAPYEAADLPQS